MKYSLACIVAMSAVGCARCEPTVAVARKKTVTQWDAEYRQHIAAYQAESKRANEIRRTRSLRTIDAHIRMYVDAIESAKMEYALAEQIANRHWIGGIRYYECPQDGCECRWCNEKRRIVGVDGETRSE